MDTKTKNELILGVIKRLIEYGDVPQEMSVNSLEAIFDSNDKKHDITNHNVHTSSEIDTPTEGSFIGQRDTLLTELDMLKMELESQKAIAKMLSEQIMQMELQLNQSLLPISLLGDYKDRIDPQHQQIFERICLNDGYLNQAFSEVGIAKLSNIPKHKKLLCAERKVGTVLLGSVNYKGAGNPPVLMALFAKYAINRLLQDENTSGVRALNFADTFAEKIRIIFEDANQLNYDLAICLIEPFWSKMYFYTNQLSLLYVSGNRLVDVVKSTDVENKEGYKEVCIDYTKNITFYLPTFNIADIDSEINDFKNTLKSVLLKVAKAPIEVQKSEIEKLFLALEETESKILAGDRILIFRI